MQDTPKVKLGSQCHSSAPYLMTKKPKPESSLKNQKVETEKVKNQIEIIDLEDDELRFIHVTQNGKTKENAISVDPYTEDRDLQLAVINLDDYDDGYDDLHILNFVPQNTSFARKRKPFSRPTVAENGGSSNSKNLEPSKPSFACAICVEPKTANESFSIKGCSHAYCNDCLVKYVASKLHDNFTSISCPVPDCRGLLEPEYCRNLLPKDVFDRWGNALCEAVILCSQKFYCPYKDCSALLIDDGEEVVRESECPYCRRMFCAQCKVPWHAGIECAEFQRLSKDEREWEDIMLMKLTQKNKWKRCPNCRYYVEKKSGCMYMKCRCGFAFCYNCGAQSSNISHLCPKCMH